jgi:hypothetical protein
MIDEEGRMHVLFTMFIGAGYVFLDTALLIRFQARCDREYLDWNTRRLSLAGRIPGSELLHTFDENLRRLGSYVFLQRMTQMAPLLGVLVTVLGLYVVNLGPEASTNPTQIITAIRPVYLGVALGAGLAILHQFFLQSASHRTNVLRNKAQQELGSASVDPVNQALMDFAKRVQGLTVTLSDQVTEISERTTGEMGQLAAQLEQLRQNVNRITQTCDKTGTALEQAARNIEEGTRASMTTMKDTTAQSVKELAKQSHTLQTKLQNVVTGLGNTVGGMERAIQNLPSGVDTLNQSAGELYKLVQTMVQTQATVSENEVARRAAVQHGLDELSQMASHLTPASKELAQCATRMNESQKEYESARNSMQAVAADLEESLKAVRQNHSDLSKMLAQAIGQELSSTLAGHINQQLAGNAQIPKLLIQHAKSVEQLIASRLVDPDRVRTAVARPHAGSGNDDGDGNGDGVRSSSVFSRILNLVRR